MIFVIALGAIALSGMIPEVPGFNTYYLYFFILGAYFSINHSSWVLSQKSLIGFMVAYGVLFSIRIVYQSDIKIIEETLFVFIILNVVHLLTKTNNKEVLHNIFQVQVSLFLPSTDTLHLSGSIYVQK